MSLSSLDCQRLWDRRAGEASLLSWSHMTASQQAGVMAALNDAAEPKTMDAYMARVSERQAFLYCALFIVTTYRDSFAAASDKTFYGDTIAELDRAFPKLPITLP